VTEGQETEVLGEEIGGVLQGVPGVPEGEGVLLADKGLLGEEEEKGARGEGIGVQSERTEEREVEETLGTGIGERGRGTGLEIKVVEKMERKMTRKM